MPSLTDSAPDGEPDPAAGRAHAAPGGGLTSLAKPALRLAAGAAHIAIGAGRQSVALISSPSHGASLAGAISRDAATSMRLLLTPADAATAIKGDPGVSRRVAWSSPLSLREIKHVAHTHGGTVNDVLLAAVSGALRHYLQDHDSSAAEIQAMVPFNLRDLDQTVPRELGNKFGLVFMPLPVGTSGSYRRLVEVHRRMQEIKDGRDGAVSYGMLSLTGLTPSRSNDGSSTCSRPRAPP
jgi:diacylglycerol O-acyltransferase / wax synthase